MIFSERYGYKPVKTAIQKDSMDQDLRNSLWNVLKTYYWDSIRETPYSSQIHLSRHGNEHLRVLCQTVWIAFLRCVCGGEAMANIIQDGSYVLAADTAELKSFEQELESAHLVGEWQIPRRPGFTGRTWAP
jgi:AbiJ N-terminal domain 4